MKKKWYKFSLFFFFLVACIGTLLRSVHFFSLNFPYQNLVHSHSHVAFQGWIYTIIILLLVKTFVSPNRIYKRRYILQYKLSIATVLMILIAFTLQGYGLYSIIFSTIFQLLNYWFIYSFFQDTKSNIVRKSLALQFIKAGLVFGIISTFIPFGIGFLSAKKMQHTEIYNALVYTFMHLQYNAWFLMVVLGLFYHWLEKNQLLHHKKYAQYFYWIFLVNVIPSTSLSLLNMNLASFIILPIAYGAAILQLLALCFFYFSLPKSFFIFLVSKNKWFKLFFLVFLVSFFIKMTAQSLAVFPIFTLYAFSNKFVILAYLHLNFIGILSFFFIAYIIDKKWLRLNFWNKVGSIFLLFGFFSTETLLITSSIGWYHSNLLLLWGSFSMALGIALLMVEKKLFNP